MNSEISFFDAGELLRTIQLEGGPNQRFEVEVCERGGGRRELTLKELSFGTGVGWFVQKSIWLEAPQVEALLKALCCLRAQPSRTKCPLIPPNSGKPVHPAEILRFDPTRVA